MRPPEEILLRYLLPNLRGLTAHALKRRGYSQSKISFVLGVSQAAVSSYLAKQSSTYQNSLEEMGIPPEEIEMLAKSILAASSEGPEQVTRVLLTGWQRMLISGQLCQLHRKLYPELADCTICLAKPVPQQEERAKILQDIGRAVALIERSPELLKIYPEVSMNIAVACEGASSLDDVAAIPGRIVKLDKKLVAVSRPEFGASKHLATILLGLVRIDQRKKAIINAKPVEGVEEAARIAGLKMGKTTPKSLTRTEEEVVFSVLESLAQERDLDLVVDEGGLGLEPAAYCFNSTAEGAAKKLIALARSLPEVRRR
jgi:predicted fused transcriptional regulator/phosphomethylpyrimidine kinase/predicted transcriptional regulator